MTTPSKLTDEQIREWEFMTFSSVPWTNEAMADALFTIRALQAETKEKDDLLQQCLKALETNIQCSEDLKTILNGGTHASS
jgi:hypothetical protein